eukprot:TRINITY_DN1931_c0_g1_i2.p2 TRINITY_DN1931_c0_g1~~TRINITY_DN1931_c0_g1_i2.p2  ORF type:complete len:288 (+),score=98.67 TRINITY_DN1931_c0_g1_i2:821-1684(+)
MRCYWQCRCGYAMLLRAYKKKDPPTAEEQEYVENLYDCLCAMLRCASNHTLFDQSEGLNLMLIVIKSKKMFRRCALRVIDYQLQDSPASCAAFVEALGLKSLFAAFMHKGVKKLSKAAEREDDEHTAWAIVSLFRHVDRKHTNFARLLNKFVESSYEKVDRLVELYGTYRELVAAHDAKAAAERREFEETLKQCTTDADANEVLAEFDDRAYLDRLEAGLYVLQGVCLLMGFVSKEDEKLHAHLLQLLQVHSVDKEAIKKVLTDYAAMLDDTAQSLEKQTKELAASL